MSNNDPLPFPESRLCASKMANKGGRYRNLFYNLFSTVVGPYWARGLVILGYLFLVKEPKVEQLL